MRRIVAEENSPKVRKSRTRLTFINSFIINATSKIQSLKKLAFLPKDIRHFLIRNCERYVFWKKQKRPKNVIEFNLILLRQNSD